MPPQSRTFYFAGQWSFGNRGCEALIRSNTKLLRERFPGARLICPSTNVTLDRRQWPDAEANGVDFVPAPKVPFVLKLWNKAYGVAPQIRALGIPPQPLDAETRRQIDRADALLMTGGDIISLDYGLLSLYYWVGVVEGARRLGKPTHLIAASVGPFSEDPAVERQMVGHLAGYTSITVRETATFAYLQKLGLTSVRLVTDPAFVLDPEPWDIAAVTEAGRDYLGLNVSPLVRRFCPTEESRTAFDREIVIFMREVLATSPLDILLVPHVDPLTGTDTNSDRQYLQQLLDAAGDTAGRVTLLPDGLNAAQLKYALGRCRYFIGARTHATIGAISQSVPTLSIAYSVKAVGINNDLFGSTNYVLPTPDVTARTLADGLWRIKADEDWIKTTLAEKLIVWRQNARQIPEALAKN